jgi:formate hydrogenlyase subunit 3/multisubunit Na+/H+ antiporter MnhD subunit
MSVILMASLFALALLIETCSWLIKAKADQPSNATAISRTNIILYSSRILTLTFSIILSYSIEKNDGHNQSIAFIIFIAFTLATAMHALLIYDLTNKNIVTEILSRLTYYRSIVKNRNAKFDMRFTLKLFTCTLVATIFLGLGVTLPYVLSLHFSQYRMTMLNLSQFLNGVGTIILLFFVDSFLYKKMDAGDMHKFVSSYILGRASGLMICALIIYLIEVF